MSQYMIEAENISKYYRLGIPGSRTIQEDLKNWFRRKRVELPAAFPSHPTAARAIWALKNISFELSRGEVLGILGRNGAGKSTLLKIISRISLPTSGKIRGKGRVASLLEIGTGFHRELSGRENIYLYGHIMGMKKREIDRRFDEIVSFADMELLLDTPVKRYSSGTHVRLAFAVAVHLDPEILIIDEVLAVGDYAFQKQCVAKMKKIASEEGRTILFVSHNMQTLKNICDRAMLLHQGEMMEIGDPARVISNYMKKENNAQQVRAFDSQDTAPGNGWIRIRRLGILRDEGGNLEEINTGTPIKIFFECWIIAEMLKGMQVALALLDLNGDCIFELNSSKSSLKKGTMRGEARIPSQFLRSGYYTISLFFRSESHPDEFHCDSCLDLNLEESTNEELAFGILHGAVRPDFPFELHEMG
ncbi:MAG: ABC transporter ATP-binding protein [Chitinophagales bacterium]